MRIAQPSTDTRSIQYWAERKVMSNAVEKSKSWHKANYFSYLESAIARRYFDMTTEEFVARRDAYIKSNPMKFSPSTKKFWVA